MRIKVLASGSKGNSTYIETDDAKILIDVGINYITLQSKLEEISVSPEEIEAVFITHTHTDHIKGLASFVKRTKAKVYGSSPVLEELTRIIPENNLHVIEKEMTYKDMEIETFKTSHDAKGSLLYKIKNKQDTLVYITDTGYVNERYFKALSNATIYVLESNHDEKMLMDGPYPYYLKQRVIGDEGHLSNHTAGTYLTSWIGPKTKYIILAHLSENNNTEEIAFSTVDGILKASGIDLPIIIAKQRDATDVIEV